VTNWIDAVTERSGTDPATAKDTLERFRVRANRQVGKPHKLLITRVAFRGERGSQEGEPPTSIDFAWDIGPGVWCVASEDNLVGKTTVLEMIRFGLRGRADFQADVLAWVREVEVSGQIDEDPFAVRARFIDGHISGELVAGPAGALVGSFQSQEAADEVIAEFMMSRLGIEPLPYWSDDKGAGSERAMSWQAYSSALYIKGLDYLIGEPETGWGGGAGKMLELFIGAPWTSTLAQAQVAVRHQEQQINAARRRLTLDKAAAIGSLSGIEGELAAAQSKLEAMPDESGQVSQLDDALDELTGIDARLVDLRRRDEELAEQRQAARQIELEDTRRLRDLTENEHTVAFFAKLEPTMCPRCETTVTSERREREATADACSICGSDFGHHEHDPSVVENLTANIGTAKAALEEIATEREQIGLEITDLVSRRQSLRKQADSLTMQTGTQQRRRELELAVARLEGAVSARRDISDDAAPDDGIVSGEQDLVILKAAVAEAEARLRESEGDLFAAVNDEIVKVSHRFGFDSLESVKLDRAARLRVRKGGTDTWYSKLTPGEQLRAKVAVVIAMLRVSSQRGVGRFPGLLLLDSPGQQETSGEDVHSMLEELQRITKELDGLQIVAASAQAPLVRDVLPAEHLRVAGKGEKLW
jgi:hypothetical protein